MSLPRILVKRSDSSTQALLHTTRFRFIEYVSDDARPRSHRSRYVELNDIQAYLLTCLSWRHTIRVMGNRETRASPDRSVCFGCSR